MPIVQITPSEEIMNKIKQQTEVWERLIIRKFQQVGEECSNQAKSLNIGTFTDRTGNLRSSIGYIIVKDGELYSVGDFRSIKNGAKGSSEGVEYAKSLISKFPRGIALVVVAGMNYAGYVEAKSLDVITGQELYSSRRLKELLTELTKNIHE